MRSLQQFWSMRRIGEARVTLVRLGPMRLWLARAEKEWGFASEQGEPGAIMDIAQVPEDVVPDKLEWQNTLFHEAPREFLLRPVTPDRPVVIKPEHAIQIPPGESGRFFALLPVFIQVVVVMKKKELVLGTVSSLRPSDTWFGTPYEGDLAYSLPDRASLDLEALKPLPYQIVTPFEIQNKSEEFLVFEKLCLRPQYTGLYSGVRHLWSSVVRIQHEGFFKSTHVRYATTQPDYEEGLMQVAQPLKREDKGLHRLTFGTSFSRDIIFAK